MDAQSQMTPSLIEQRRMRLGLKTAALCADALVDPATYWRMLGGANTKDITLRRLDASLKRFEERQ
jgi:hypothetical protein